MNRFNFIIFLALIFVTDFSLAQVPSCPCDTLDVNGISGNEIIELVCPGGELAVGAVSEVSAETVGVALIDTVAYAVITPQDEVPFCFITREGDQGGGSLDDQEAQDCRDRLIQGCNLQRINPIPTIAEWGMITMAVALGIIGLLVVTRRRKAAA